jgi:hypothetical protein
MRSHEVVDVLVRKYAASRSHADPKSPDPAADFTPSNPGHDKLTLAITALPRVEFEAQILLSASAICSASTNITVGISINGGWRKQQKSTAGRDPTVSNFVKGAP